MRNGCTRGGLGRRLPSTLISAVAIATLALPVGSSVTAEAPRRETSDTDCADSETTRGRSPVEQFECFDHDDFMALYGDQVRMVAEAMKIDEMSAATGLRLQEGFGMFTAFAKASADSYGGAWMEWAPTPRLVIALVATETTESDRAFLDEQARISGLPLEFGLARTSYRDLVVASETLTNLTSGAPNVGVMVDERAGRVNVTGPAEIVRALPSSVGDVEVAIEVATITEDTTIAGGWRTGECTIAFGVVAPPNAAGGTTRTGVMTAGHCHDDAQTYSGVTTNAANPSYDWNASPDVDNDLSNGSQPNWEHLHGIDYQIFELNAADSSSNHLEVPNVNITRQSLVALPVNATVFVYGGSGFAHCPGRLAVNANTVQGYDTRSNLKVTSAAPMGTDGGRSTVGGDSGGPVYYLDAAVGIVWGSFNDEDDSPPGQPWSPNLCNTGGSTYVSRIDNQLTRSP